MSQLACYTRLHQSENFSMIDGLAVLPDRNMLWVYKLQRPVAELTVVVDSFHTRPLLRIMQSADRY